MDILSQWWQIAQGWFGDIEFAQFLATCLKIAVVLIICFIAIKIGTRVIKMAFSKASTTKNSKRAQTLSTVCCSLWRYLVYFITAMVVMSLLNINIMPVLASAGVAGIAIGFGAQSLVKDVISGFFMLFENYYEVGDYVECAGIKGFVEEVGLRSTKIRDWSGELHICPNGHMMVVTNYSRGDINTIVPIPVSYGGDLSSAMYAIKEVCVEIKEQYAQVTDGPTVLGVGNLEKGQVIVNILFSSALNDKFAIERQLRLRCKEALDRLGMSIPYSYSKVMVDENAAAADNDNMVGGLG